MKHTPGPWTVIPGSYDSSPNACEFPHGPEIMANGVSIASLPLYGEDDACLIAAAPNMQAALEAIAGFGSVNLDTEYRHGLRDIIRSMTDCAKRALNGAD